MADDGYIQSIDELAERELAAMKPASAKPSRAKKSGRVGATDSEGKPRKQSDILVDIGRTHELFHDAGRTAYALTGNAVYMVDSGGYREVLAEQFLCVTGKGANRNAIGDATATLSSLAKFRGTCHPVWLRVAADGDNVVIDTGEADGSVIIVTASGVRAESVSPVRFRRSGGMLALPRLADPDFSLIWRYLNVSEDYRPLIAAFLLAVFRPSGPYPHLFLDGEQGSGKSTFTKVIRRLTDPSAAPLRAPPKDVRDLLVGALNGWVLALDNLSFMTPQMSDALCRLATGGAISERALYTNTDEVLVEVQRPCIVNGIEDVATRPDLAERGLHVELEMIRDRKAEGTIWRDFDADAPAIFSGLLHGLSQSIRTHRDIDLGRLPRMADFAKWAAAGMEPLGFTADQFMTAYRANIETGLSAGIESSIVGRALMSFIRSRGQWTGTAADLLTALSMSVDESTTRSPSWPKSPRGLSGSVTRLAPALRHHGITVDRPSRSGDSRLWALCNRPIQPSQPSQPSFAGDGHDGHDGQNPVLHDDPAEAYRRAKEGE